MTIEQLQHQHRQYAVNELATIDHINNPSETQIQAKMQMIANWDWFKGLAAQATA